MIAVKSFIVIAYPPTFRRPVLAYVNLDIFPGTFRF
jgi:hypothetical protein